VTSSRTRSEDLSLAASRNYRRRHNSKAHWQCGPHESLAGWQGIIKRFADISVAAIGLIALSPLLALIAVTVFLADRGPVFYRQTRVGLRGRHFTIIKFRTMIDDAEQESGPVWAPKGDSRCTTIGNALRRMGLDELPQLWNILRGDMSLIGPRPERPEFTRRFRQEHQDYEVRDSVRPGMTGFAQVHGWRGCTSLNERLRHDLHYVRHWSLAMDVRVFMLTFVRGWSERTRSGIA